MGNVTKKPEADMETPAASKSAPTFTVVGFQVSDHMPISIDSRSIDLANVTPEVTAWLYERRDKISGLAWTE